MLSRFFLRLPWQLPPAFASRCNWLITSRWTFSLGKEVIFEIVFTTPFWKRTNCHLLSTCVLSGNTNIQSCGGPCSVHGTEQAGWTWRAREGRRAGLPLISSGIHAGLPWTTSWRIPWTTQNQSKLTPQPLPPPSIHDALGGHFQLFWGPRQDSIYLESYARLVHRLFPKHLK